MSEVEFRQGIGFLGEAWVVRLEDGRAAWVSRCHYPFEKAVRVYFLDGTEEELPHDTPVVALLTPDQAGYLAIQAAVKPHALGTTPSIRDTPAKRRKQAAFVRAMQQVQRLQNPPPARTTTRKPAPKTTRGKAK